MRVALVDTVKRRKYYPLPFLKIGAWLKDTGHECKLFDKVLPKKGEFDEIWITTVFTFDISYSLAFVREAKYRANKVIVGGIAATLLPDVYEAEGVEVHRGLHPEAEKYALDYSLLNEDPEYSVTHTSRGCIRKCEFCMVKEVEPKFYNKRDWEKDIHPSSKHIVFYDNNWSAKSLKVMQEDAEKIRSLISSQGVRTVDFNQSLDCRVITPDKVKIISSLPIRPIRFSCDSNDDINSLLKTLKLFVEYNRKVRFMIDMLFNFEEKPGDIYTRARRITEFAQEYNLTNVSIFPMRYAPIKELNSRGYVGKYWTEDLLIAFRVLRQVSTRTGTISPHGLAIFEYWYGKDEREFLKLLNYPKLKKLLNIRRAKFREMGHKKINMGEN